MSSDEIIANQVRKFWGKRGYACNVVVFFEQKFAHEQEYERCAELVTCNSQGDLRTVCFENDFCEGQTDVRGFVVIVPLDAMIGFYQYHCIDAPEEDDYENVR